MHVLTVVGARPQFIKAFPVSRALADHHEETLVHTGQHYDRTMSDVFFEELEVPEPDYHLGVGSATAGVQIGQMMEHLQPIVDKESPDVVLTYGDTHSTLAAATVGAHADTLLAHVEAGLRSNNRTMPEEINRILTDHASDLLFAPTARAVQQLEVEGITEGVHLTGDVMVDALHWAREVASSTPPSCQRYGFEPRSYVVATIHRAANTDDIDRLRGIIASLGRIDDPVIVPAHPRTVERLERADALSWAKEQVMIIEPLGYVGFIDLVANARRIITDSGGVQKEAFLLDTPCVTLRNETEWPETLTGGWNTLVGADPDALEDAVSRSVVIDDKPRPFGDGTAAPSIRGRLELAVDDRTGIRHHSGTSRSTQPPSGDYPRGN